MFENYILHSLDSILNNNPHCTTGLFPSFWSIGNRSDLAAARLMWACASALLMVASSLTIAAMIICSVRFIFVKSQPTSHRLRSWVCVGTLLYLAVVLCWLFSFASNIHPHTFNTYVFRYTGLERELLPDLAWAGNLWGIQVSPLEIVQSVVEMFSHVAEISLVSLSVLNLLLVALLIKKTGYSKAEKANLLVRGMRNNRAIFYLGAVLLSFTIFQSSSLHAWSIAYINGVTATADAREKEKLAETPASSASTSSRTQPDNTDKNKDRPSLEVQSWNTLLRARINALSLIGSLLLVALYAPAAWLLHQQAEQLEAERPKMPAGWRFTYPVETCEQKKALDTDLHQKLGLDSTPWVQLPRLLAMLAPIITGSFAQILDILKPLFPSS